MKIIYRISDAGYNKVKPDYINNENCLKNFVSVFGNENLYIIADNCSEPTLNMIEKYVIPSNIEKVSVGHGAGTFNLALDKALTWDDDEIVYFLENDYLHKQNSPSILKEGFDLGVDYGFTQQSIVREQRRSIELMFARNSAEKLAINESFNREERMATFAASRLTDEIKIATALDLQGDATGQQVQTLLDYYSLLQQQIKQIYKIA